MLRPATWADDRLAWQGHLSGASGDRGHIRVAAGEYEIAGILLVTKQTGRTGFQRGNVRRNECPQHLP